MLSVSEYARLVEAALDERFAADRAGLEAGHVPPPLNEAMRYSLLAGGKRLRPAMLLAAVDMLRGDRAAAIAAAGALEMIHTYSLIHDDLPGMDDDDLRRGRPTSHMVFGEGQAILAGDALLTEAFHWMLENALQCPDTLPRHARAMREIALAAGARGMVGGQSIDLACERGPVERSEAALEYIHEHKTACLFIGALRAGGHIAGADDRTLNALTDYARAFGLMFQTADDLLDAEGDEASLGKRVQKDADKLTAVALYGRRGARARVDALMAEALLALGPIGARADFFRDLVQNMRGRET
ncbi:MAG: farnesyl diphosphate synthase [Eubacteriales bacterium]|nr:farnesyl diphosphate synthase [Eubacteriales bacterium]